mmetsp:Transcript_49897/g.117412  ORF Transcript_49897/g.117412 Transcript_49897/m.117412 type:complete len:203 (+) Transcript_49897:817-1425(+)
MAPCLCHVVFHAEASPEIVLAADQQKAHCRLRPAHGSWQLHSATAVDDHDRWHRRTKPMFLSLPEVWQNHLASPGAEDHGLNFLVHAGLEDLVCESLQIRRRSTVRPAWRVDVIRRPRASDHLNLERWIAAQLGVNRAVDASAGTWCDDGHGDLGGNSGLDLNLHLGADSRHGHLQMAFRPSPPASSLDHLRTSRRLWRCRR